MQPSLAELQRALAARIVAGEGSDLDTWICVRLEVMTTESRLTIGSRNATASLGADGFGPYLEKFRKGALGE